MTRLEVVPLPCTREVVAGDDLGALVLRACEEADVTLVDGDVVCVAQKVVSKAEGAVIDAPPSDDLHAARRRIAADQAVRIVADAPWVLVVETHHGLVCANAGVDASNLPDGRLALLPEDPDGSAARLRASLEEAAQARLGVLVTDTFGRPWRMGQTDVAIGASGVAVIRDERGGHDRFGRRLEVTEAAVADAIAAAADLVRRKADGTPFVVVRGADVLGDATASELVRPAAEDLFRVGGPRAVLAGLEDADVTRPADIEVLEELRAHAMTHVPPDAAGQVRLRTTSDGLVLEHRDRYALAAGIVLAAARIAAHTTGRATRWEARQPDPPAPGGWVQPGILLVGRPTSVTRPS